MIDFGCANRHDFVLLAPGDESREIFEPAQQVRQGAIIHIGLPAQATGLFPVHFPEVHLFGRWLVRADLLELGL